MSADVAVVRFDIRVSVTLRKNHTLSPTVLYDVRIAFIYRQLRDSFDAAWRRRRPVCGDSPIGWASLPRGLKITCAGGDRHNYSHPTFLQPLEYEISCLATKRR